MTYDRRAFLKTTVAASAALMTDVNAGAQPPALFPGFVTQKIKTSGATIHTLRGGSGPPLLLLHGYPQTHVMWHKIAPRLAQRFTVVMTDLRGYGDSSKPPDGENHVNYSKRAMALDQVEVMRSLGFEKFAVVGTRSRRARDVANGGRASGGGHEGRGARYRPVAVFAGDPRVGHAVFPLVLPDPAGAISGDADRQQRRVLPAVAVSAPGCGGQVFTPEAVAEYLRCFKDPATIHATCEDYRAGASIDIDHAGEDGAKKVMCPLLVLWGERGTVGRLEPVMDIWREKAVNVTGKSLPAGHFLPEEVPEETLSAVLDFLS